MTIRKKLSLYFTTICAAVLLVAMGVIFVLFLQVSRSNFYGDLKDRASLAGQLYLEADELNKDSLSKLRAKYLDTLPGEIIRIYNNKDTAQFIKPAASPWTRDIIDHVRAEKYLSFIEGKRQTVGIFYPDNQGNFVIMASAVDVDSDERLQFLLQVMIPLFVIITAGIYGAGTWFSRRALNPINGIIRQVNNIRAVNLQARINGGTNNDEIAELARQFNLLLEHLDNAFTIEKNFSAHVSHELRTPLTGIIGEIEVALQKNRHADEYRQALSSVLGSAEELHNIVTNLFELSLIVASGMLSVDIDNVQLDELIWSIQDRWNGSLGKNLLKVNIPVFPAQQEDFCIRANINLLNIAVNNIIQNAFKFSGQQEVTCTLKLSNQHIDLSVTDLGPGITDANMAHIFNPFFSVGKNEQLAGNGIGLYLSDKIVRLYGGSILVSSTPGAGATFTLRFNKL